MLCDVLRRFLIACALWLCVSYTSAALIPHETRSSLGDVLVHASCLNGQRHQALPVVNVAGGAA